MKIFGDLPERLRVFHKLISQVWNICFGFFRQTIIQNLLNFCPKLSINFHTPQREVRTLTTI